MNEEQDIFSKLLTDRACSDKMRMYLAEVIKQAPNARIRTLADHIDKHIELLLQIAEEIERKKLQ